MCGTEEVVVLCYNVTDYMYICVDRTDNLTILNLHFIAQSAGRVSPPGQECTEYNLSFLYILTTGGHFYLLRFQTELRRGGAK